MISAMKEISKEIDWGDNLKQVYREDLSRKAAFELGRGVSFVINQGRALQAEGSPETKGLMWERA